MPDDIETTATSGSSGTGSASGSVSNGGTTGSDSAPITGKSNPVMRQSDASDMLDQAKSAAQEAVAALIPDLEKMVKDAARAAVTSLLDDIKEPAGLPPLVHSSWDGIKTWMRREADLMLAGHSAETRAELNP